MANGEKDIVADDFERKCCEKVAGLSKAGGILLLTASVMGLSGVSSSPLVFRWNPYRNYPEVAAYAASMESAEFLKARKREMIERGDYNTSSLDKAIMNELDRSKEISSDENVKRYNAWNDSARRYCLTTAAVSGGVVAATMLAPAIGAIAVPKSYRFVRKIIPKKKGR